MTVPAAVRAAWGWDQGCQLAPITGGLINATYAVRRDGAPIAVVQRLHPIFAGEVNLDLERVTAHLAAAGMVTPRLVRTLGGAAWLTDGDQTWRALTWVDGVAHHAAPASAVAAAAAVGRGSALRWHAASASAASASVRAAPITPGPTRRG